VGLLALFGASTSPAGILPVFKLDAATVEAFNRYVSGYEKDAGARFGQSRSFRIDSESGSKKAMLDSGRIIAEIVRAENIADGHVYHLYGAMHIAGITVDQVRHTMQNYAKYSEYYKPDVSQSSGEMLPDSVPSDQHFRVSLKLQQSTLWIDVAFDTTYDTHYLKLDDHSFQTWSRSTSIREYKDAHNPSLGTFPEGDDHGFLWRIDTWWHARNRDGGVDLEFTNITLTRPVPFGFGWWASRKAKTSIENLLARTREAVLSAQRAQSSAP
jgi:hypothetical protein